MDKYIDAVRWMFGMNKTEARKYVSEAKENGGQILETILEGYQQNAKKSFLND